MKSIKIMSTPNTFLLPQPIDNTKCPQPKPPTYVKHQVYDDASIFEKVDHHAIRVARNKHSTFRDLLWDLVFRYKLNELEKARVIFRWITTCDVNNISFQAVQKGSPEELLLSLKNLKVSYANVLELISGYAGLCCLTIHGYAKGVDYRPGDVFKGKAFNHSWNAIYIQDSWQLIDAHWASRYLATKKDTQDAIVYQYDDFYFLMEPQQAVYSHFPQDSDWQLLKEPLTLDQFENLPLTKSQFFKCGMNFANQNHGVVHSKNGNLKMSLGFLKPDSFTYKLAMENNSEVFQGVSLKYFVIQETVNNEINFYFRFPAPGNYFLTVFVQELSDHDLPASQESIFRAACEYKIIADKAAANSLPYPMSCHDLNWGPQWALISHYNLAPVEEDGVICIKSPDNKPFVRKEIKFEKMREDVELLCKLRKNGVEDEDSLDQYIEILEKDDETTFILNLPEPGEYGLEIYANEPSEEDTYTHICQYLLDFEPPPGYKQQSSVFGPIKVGSNMSIDKPSNIKEMYNYEKDAAPMGMLPKPYLESQYALEDVTMIPGQAKIKPKPFEYNETNKSDDSDLEVPDFLPPPPVIGIVPQLQHTQSSMPNANTLLGDNLVSNNSKFTQPSSTNDLSIHMNGNARPSQVLGGHYAPEDQRMTAGINLPHGVYKGDNYASLQSATPYTKSYSGDDTQIKISDSTYHPFDEQRWSEKDHAGDKSRSSDEEIMEQTVRLQPYLANVEKGLSPQLSRKVYDNSNQNKKPDPKDSLTKIGDAIDDEKKLSASFGGNLGTRQYSSGENDRRFDFSELNIVSSAFGRSGSPTSKQPYLKNLEKGSSPILSRKPLWTHDSTFETTKVTGPSSSTNKFDSIHDTNKPTVFRGYGRPNFSSGQDAGNDPGSSADEHQIQSSIIHAQQSSYDSSVDPSLRRSGPFKEGSARAIGSTEFSRSYEMIRNAAESGKGTDQRSSSYRVNSSTISQGPNRGVVDDKNAMDAAFQGRSPYKEASSKASDQGYILGNYGVVNDSATTGNNSMNRSFQGRSPYKEDSSKALYPGYDSGSYVVHSAGVYDKSSLQSKIHGKEDSSTTIGGINLCGSYKDEQFSSKSDPGYRLGSWEARHPPESIDSRNDSRKTSSLSVNLSPSGFIKPNQIDLSSDQYNNQYEDSSKIMPSPMQKYRPDESTANWTSGPVQKEPPQNFQAKPIDFEEEIYKPEIKALPKGELINSNINPEETSKIFQRIDDHAIQVSAQHQDSFNQLIWQLIYARNITDELEKVRVIFLWLCTKDLHKMNFDDFNEKDSPEEILMGLKTGKSTYAQIFLTLCRYAGLHCKLIVGYAKGADYVPGMKFQGRQGEHSWNSVFIASVWRLVDCHWAARRLIGKERKPENVRYELDMFYFLANPSQLIYTHFPHEQDWQLLHHPITIEEFESLAPVKSMFFKYNLDLVTHRNAIINADAPEFELRIAFPKGVEERLLFTFTLTFNDGSDDYNGLSLLRYGRQEIDYISSQSHFYIRAPIPGSYKLLLYTKLISLDHDAPQSDSQNMFGAICEYKVEFYFPSLQAKLPFPSCQTSTYGPSELYKKYPIESRVTKSSIYAENGRVEIKFRILKPETRIMAKLISAFDRNIEELTEKCVLQRLVGSEEAIINAFLPEAGEYGLEVYANSSRKDGNSFYTVWQYLLVAGSASAVNGLPSLSPGYMGPFEPKFSSFGLSTYSHKDPFIVANTGDLCIQLKTSREKPVRIMTQLIHCSNNVSEMCANQVLQQARDSIVYFLVRLPYAGFFKLQIFALPYSEMSENLPGVFNYLIEGNQSSSHSTEFPQQFSQWKEGCYLYEPTDGVLGLTGRPNAITFRMDVPRANGMAVVVNNAWTRLERDPNGTWVGSVDMRLLWGRPAVDQMTVCANYCTSFDDSYATILKYLIK